MKKGLPEQSTTNALAPFSCQYSAQVPELLQKLNCSLAVSTYQAGKLIFLSPKDESTIVQLPRNFEKPMGFSFSPDYSRLALACKDEVIIFSNSAELAKHYPKSPNKYDSLYLPRVTYHTGPLDIHDLRFGTDNTLFAVNTLFSCIVTIDENYNFTPYWYPDFIDKLASEDRCHLNGMAMQNGKPKYASAFGRGNTPQSWRENVTKTGIIIDIENDQIIAENLPMPHSPQIYGNDLYVLLSATGQLARINRDSGSYEVVCDLGGFARGMSLHKDYLFVGLSKLRKNSSTFAQLDFAHQPNECAIMIIYLPTGSVAGKITYSSSVDEIYDIHVLPDSIRPNILNTLTPEHKDGLTTPQSTYWAKTTDQK